MNSGSLVKDREAIEPKNVSNQQQIGLIHVKLMRMDRASRSWNRLQNEDLSLIDDDLQFNVKLSRERLSRRVSSYKNTEKEKFR